MVVKKTKILLVLPSHKFDIFIQGLVRNSSDEFEFHAILFDGEFSRQPISNTNGYAASYSLGKLDQRFLIKNILRCRQIIKSVHPDIVHVTTYFSAITIMLSISTLVKKPKFLWNRHYNKGQHNLNSRIHVKVDGLLVSRSDVTVVISHSQFETLVYAEKSEVSKIRVINNGIDMDLLKVSSGARSFFRDRFRDRENGLVLLAVGRIHPEKDYLTLFNALALFREVHPKFHLYIAGEGDSIYKQSLLSAIADLDLNLNVTFLGWVEDIHSAMIECDLLVQSSLDEAFGLAILEAAALGIPIATTTPGGVIEIVSEFHPFVAPSDFNALAQVMAEKILETPEKRTYIASRILSKFPISKMAIEYNQIYRDLKYASQNFKS